MRKLSLIVILSTTVFLSSLCCSADELTPQIDEEMAKLEKLQKTEEFLRKKYKGWDTKIDEFMSIARLYELSPERVSQPIVVSLLGFPGGGKTTFLQDFTEQMDWTNRMHSTLITKGQTALPMEQLQEATVYKKSDLPVSGPQTVLFVDEIQNLEKEEALKDQHNDSDGVKLIKAQKRAEREMSHGQVWWEALGNGKITGSLNNKSKIEMKNNIAQIKAYATVIDDLQWKIHRNLNPYTYSSSESEDGFENKNEKKELTEEAQKKLAAEKAVKAQQDEIRMKNENEAYRQQIKQHETALISVVNWIYNNHKALLGDGAQMSRSELIEAITKKGAPKKLHEELEEKYKSYNPINTGYLTKALIVIAGNPEFVIQKIRDELGEGVIDPDQLNQAIKRSNLEPEIENWFHEIFGHKPGWDSRLNLSSWKLIESLTSQEWKELISERLDAFANDYSKRLKERGIEAELSYHPSVHNVIYKIAVDPQGARVLEGTMNKILGSFMTELWGKTVLSKPEDRVMNLVVGFDSNENRLIAMSPDSPVAKRHDSDWINSEGEAKKELKVNDTKSVNLEEPQKTTLTVNLNSLEKTFGKNRMFGLAKGWLKGKSLPSHAGFNIKMIEEEAPPSDNAETSNTIKPNLFGLKFAAPKKDDLKTNDEVTNNPKAAASTEGLFFTKKVGIPERVSRPIITDPEKNVDLKRVALHQAGHATVGTIFFGSVPRTLSRRTGGNLEGMWDEPNAETLHHKYKLLMALMGGLAAESYFSDDTYLSELADADVKMIRKLIENIIGELDHRKNTFKFEGGLDSNNYSDVIPRDLNEHPLFKAIIETNGNSAAALKAAFESALDILAKNEAFTKAIANELEKKSSLTSLELTKLAKTNLRSIDPISQVQLLKANPGSHTRGCDVLLSKTGKNFATKYSILNSLLSSAASKVTP